MKILHINTYDTKGGAARAAYRIHSALKTSGLSSMMCVAQKGSSDQFVFPHKVYFQGRKYKFTKKLLSLCSQQNPSFRSLALFPSGIAKVINNSGADIVNLHWIGKEFVNISEIKKIKIPIVWTLHDMWVFCGTEHCESLNYPGRYKNLNYSVSYLGQRRSYFDLDKWNWKRKRKHWRSIPFNFVTPSKWLADCLFSSSLFPRQKATVIPNCINTSVYKSLHSHTIIQKFNLFQNTKTLLFGADYATENPLKGHRILEKSINRLGILFKDEIQCVIFGSNHKKTYRKDNVIIHEIGTVDNDRELIELYNFADVFVTPSMIDNLPNTIMEAMSCSTPCVAFNIGGIPDLIDDKYNGYLATPYSVDDFAKGIYWVLTSNKNNRLGLNARNKVLQNYTYDDIASKYISLYKKILSSQ